MTTRADPGVGEVGRDEAAHRASVGCRIVGQLERAPVGFELSAAKAGPRSRLAVEDELRGQEHQNGDGHGRRLKRSAAAARRATATSQVSSSATSANQATPFSRWRRSQCASSCATKADLVRRDPSAEQRVPEDDAARRAQAGHLGVQCRRPLEMRAAPRRRRRRDRHGARARVPGRRAHGRAAGRAAAPGRDGCRSYDGARPGKHDSAGDPPALAEAARQRDREQERDATSRCSRTCATASSGASISRAAKKACSWRPPTPCRQC